MLLFFCLVSCLIIQPFNSLTLPCLNRRKQGTITKIYSAMRTMPVWFRATEIKKTKGSESVRKAGLSVDNSASPQTIPPTVLRGMPGTLSFTTLLPKSPGQLLHPLRKVFQTYSFPKLSRHEVPELNSRRATRRGLKTFIC